MTLKAFQLLFPNKKAAKTGQGLTGSNMFAYCGNNPVMRVDPYGNAWYDPIISFFKEYKKEILLIASVLFFFIGVKKEKNLLDDKIHMYFAGKGESVDGKINVIFSPNSMRDVKKEPSFAIENSRTITDENEQKSILIYIMSIDFYSQDLYQRTIDSMLIEWKAHNIAWYIFRTEQFATTNFDFLDEGKTYFDFLCEYFDRKQE